MSWLKHKCSSNKIIIYMIGLFVFLYERVIFETTNAEKIFFFKL